MNGGRLRKEQRYTHWAPISPDKTCIWILDAEADPG